MPCTATAPDAPPTRAWLCGSLTVPCCWMSHWRMRAARARNTPPALAHTRKVWQEMDLWSNLPEPLLKGPDLMAAGMVPGPALGKALALAHEMQLTMGIKDRPRLLAALRQRLPEINPRDGRACSPPPHSPTD